MSIFNFWAMMTILLGFGCDAEQGNLSVQNIKESVNDTKIFKGKMMRSDDQGKNWEECAFDLSTSINILSVLATNDGLYIGSENSDLYLNDNASKNKWLKESLKDAYVHTSETKGYTVSGIFETSKSYFANVMYDALYRKNKTTNTWQPMKLPTGLNVISDVIEDTNDNIYIAGEYGIYVSKDNGVSWKNIFMQGWTRNIVLHNNQLIISGKRGLYSSGNEGQTWENLNISKSNLNSLLTHEEHNYQLFTLGKELAILRSDYPNKNAGNGKLQVSSDGGLTWRNHTADKVLQKLTGITNVTIHNGVLYYSNIDGINASADGGLTWYPVLLYKGNQPNMTIKLYHDGKTFYAIEQNMGC